MRGKNEVVPGLLYDHKYKLVMGMKINDEIYCKLEKCPYLLIKIG